ncbi:MAG: hypothetical protein JWO30_595 [Fibrobacteres bacterium]|nr:hypothetical protein [Fibrobacterota bacterium]
MGRSTTVHALEYGVTTGIGDKFGRAGFGFQILGDRAEFTIAKHFAWQDYSAQFALGMWQLNPRHLIMADFTYGMFWEEADRICIGVFDRHDIGEARGFRLYYGINYLRFQLSPSRLLFIIPIFGTSYSF